MGIRMFDVLWLKSDNITVIESKNAFVLIYL
jgi:hypothetical protein